MDTSDGLVMRVGRLMVGQNMTKLKGTHGASKGSSGRLWARSIKVPPKPLREEAIRGLRGTFLSVGRITRSKAGGVKLCLLAKQP
jgi:hypothetical protein